MRKNFANILLVAVGLLIVSVPLSAHHGNAAYYYAKTVTIKGTVTEWVFANPHSFLKIDVTDDKGAVQHWVIESGAAAYSTQGGWSKSVIKVGDVVTVDLMPVKNGAPIGRMRQITLPDGKMLKGDTRFTI